MSKERTFYISIGVRVFDNEDADVATKLMDMAEGWVDDITSETCHAIVSDIEEVEPHADATEMEVLQFTEKHGHFQPRYIADFQIVNSLVAKGYLTGGNTYYITRMGKEVLKWN